MRFSAAVLRTVGAPVEIETVQLDHVGSNHVLVQVEASAICHTDFEVANGSVPVPLPLVLGHEMAGVVVEIGSDVHAVAVGDRVIGSWNPACGRCFFCTRGQPILCTWVAAAAARCTLPGDDVPRLHGDRGPVHVFSLMGAHAEFALLDERSAIRIETPIPPELAAMIGCTVATGVCGALRAGAVAPGSVVAVVGVGPIGLCAVQGARIAGARTIVAVDRNRQRLDLATRLGATAVVDAMATGATELVMAATGGRGADVVIEAAGAAAAFQTALDSCRPGGRVVFLGKIPSDQLVPLRFGSIAGEKEIVRASYGGARPAADFALVADLWAGGELDLDVLVTARAHLDQINVGLAALRSGDGLHTILERASA